MTNLPGYLAAMSPYELAMAFRETATRQCTSWEEDAERQAELETIGTAMDLRDVRLEDWAGR